MKIFTFCSTVMMGIFSCCCYAAQLELDKTSANQQDSCDNHLHGITQIGDKIESKKIDATIITRTDSIERSMGLIEFYRRPVATLKPSGAVATNRLWYMSPSMKVQALQKEYSALIQDVFGVGENWNLAQVKKSFRKLALICHPDKLLGCSDQIYALGEEAFMDIVVLLEIAEQLKMKN